MGAARPAHVAAATLRGLRCFRPCSETESFARAKNYDFRRGSSSAPRRRWAVLGLIGKRRFPASGVGSEVPEFLSHSAHLPWPSCSCRYAAHPAFRPALPGNRILHSGTKSVFRRSSSSAPGRRWAVLGLIGKRRFPASGVGSEVAEFLSQSSHLPCTSCSCRYAVHPAIRPALPGNRILGSGTKSVTRRGSTSAPETGRLVNIIRFVYICPKDEKPDSLEVRIGLFAGSR